MIDLSTFVGKRVVVQFRNRDAWITVHADGGKPAIAAVLDGQGNPQMIPAPFLLGEVVDKGEECFAIQIRDENQKKLEVALNPDAILTITTVVEEKVVLASAS